MSSNPALTSYEVTMLMRLALSEAERGLKVGELPIGCVVAVPGANGLRVLGRAHETNSSGSDGHALKMALAGSVAKMRPGESGVVVATTVEPCDECMDLLRSAPIRQLVYGLALPSGSGEHRISLGRDSESMISIPGVMESECRTLLSSYVDNGGHAPAAVATAVQILRHPSMRPAAVVREDRYAARQDTIDSAVRVQEKIQLRPGARSGLVAGRGRL
jgi:tRNA(Arg) A34 adenosine deaminase TadA